MIISKYEAAFTNLLKNTCAVTRIKPGLHVTFFGPFISPFSNGLNAFLWWRSHMALQNEKIKGAAVKNGLKMLHVNKAFLESRLQNIGNCSFSLNSSIVVSKIIAQW